VARATRLSTPRTALLAATAAAAALTFPGIASATVTPTLNGTDLTLRSDADDAITVTCNGSGVVQFNTTPTVLNCADLTSLAVQGGPGANAINLAGVTTTAFTHSPAPAITVHGNGGNDAITGSDFADTLYGDEDNDSIVPGKNPAGTTDDAQGGAGDDSMTWNPGQGDDLNEGGDGNDTTVVNGGGGGEQFTVKPSTLAGKTVRFDRTGPSPTPGPFFIEIGTTERLDMNANGGDDTFAAENGLAGLIALDVDGGPGNDTLGGGDGADLIEGGEGNDTIVPGRNPAGTTDDARGGPGDDTTTWNPGQGDDLNEGGEGNDTTVVNGGNVGEQFTVKPSTIPGKVRFDRTGPSPQPGPFFIEIGTTETLDMNANGGDDTFTAENGLAALGIKLDVDGGADNDTLGGGDGADLMQGGDGNDTITAGRNPAGTTDDVRGGAGDDRMIWNPGQNDDINEGGEGNDTVEINGGSVGEDFTVKPGAVAGRVRFDRTGPSPNPGAFFVDIGTSENLVLNAGAGNDEIKGFAGLAGLIRSTFNGQDGNDEIRGTDGEDLLTGGKGFDLIRSSDHAADRVECDNGIDFARVDRLDTVRGCELVLGGRQRVTTKAKSLNVSGGAAALTLKCVATQRCRGVAALRRGNRTLASARFAMGKNKTQKVSLKLTAAGRRALSRAGGKSLRVELRIDAKDSKGNGWRSTANLRLR
jgi:Ca2+-binding RTX toxin-like protein